MIDEEYIKNLKNAWRRLKDAQNKYYELRKARNFSKVKVASVYGALTAIELSKDVKLFVIVYIFTPEVLSGMKMRRGYRDFIKNLMGCQSGSYVSKRLKNLMFYYHNYNEFREEVNRGIETAERLLESEEK